MPTFESNGVAINYAVDGDGPPIVLVHGFASSLDGNWRAPGIIDALTAAGRRVIALDCRGHGKSGKPHDPEAYAGNAMADDVIALMDHLGIARTDLVGYSMGGIISAGLLVRHPERFHSVILSGVGDALVDGARWGERRTAIANAMESEGGAAAEDETARNFRIFAERTGNDLAALAAMQRAPRGVMQTDGLANVKKPVMILIGDNDTLVGSADKLAATIPGARHVTVPGDHLTAVVAPELKRAIVAFLEDTPPSRGRG